MDEPARRSLIVTVPAGNSGSPLVRCSQWCLGTQNNDIVYQVYQDCGDLQQGTNEALPCGINTGSFLARGSERDHGFILHEAADPTF